MFKTENTRCKWSKNETKELLAIMKEHQVMDFLDGKTRRNKNIYAMIADELGKKGYNKNREQVKLKFRNLKQQFHKTKRNNKKSGAERETNEFYEELNELIGNRPVAAAVGLDTTIFEEIMEVVNEELGEESLNDVPEVDVPEVDEPEVDEPEVDSSRNEAPTCSSHGTEPDRNVEKIPKKKRSAVQMTLLDISQDLKNSHQALLNAIKEENAAFFNEQRCLQDEYLKETRKIMAEDRHETKNIILDLLKK